MLKTNHGVIILGIKNNKLLMIKQHRPEWNKSGWEFPGGGIKDNENIYSASIRETKEETGYNLLNPQTLNEQHISIYLSGQIYIVKGDLSIQGENKLDKDEQITKTKLFSKEEINDLILKNKIISTQSLSAYAIALTTGLI